MGILLLSCAVLAGCAAMFVPYPQRWQSVEAAVQTILAQQGYYDGQIDGIVGPATRRAIRAYQRDYQLTPTGTINPALLASMGLAVPGAVNVAAGYPFVPWYGGPGYGGPPLTFDIGWGGGGPAGPPAGGWGGGCGGGGPGGPPGGGGGGWGGRPPGGGGGPVGGGGAPPGGGGGAPPGGGGGPPAGGGGHPGGGGGGGPGGPPGR